MSLHLAVDPAFASGHFALMEDDLYEYLVGVDIYSSETRAWYHHENGWTYNTSCIIAVCSSMACLATPDKAIVAVDI
jgi:hypothetical protein